MIATLGIDVAKHKLDAVLLEKGSQRAPIQTNKIEGYQALEEWMRQQTQSEVQVIMEATGLYSEGPARFFQERGYRVSIVNPVRISAFAKSQLRRTKTDRVDARTIAEFGHVTPLEAWKASDQAQNRLKFLTRRQNQLQRMRQQERNRLASGLEDDFIRDTIEAHLQFIDKQLQATAQQIDQLFKQSPQLKTERDLLCSIPGIGKLTAARILAELPYRSFRQSSEVVAYAGLNPKQHQSGNFEHSYTPLSKIGNENLRQALYFPAIVAKRYNPIAQALAVRLEQRGKSNMTIVGAIMKKLLQLAFGVLKTGKPFDPLYGLN